MIVGTTAYLLGFIGIIIPVAIHLWSKKTRTTIPFGTIRFLKQDDTQAVKSLTPTEWPLLLLRILVLVLFVIIMSEPLWRKEVAAREMILIDPAYRNHPDLASLIDSYQDRSDLGWFCLGFPDIKDSLLLPQTSVWELLRQLKNRPEKVTVFSPRRMTQFHGYRPEDATVTWSSLPMESHFQDLGAFVTNRGNVKIESTSETGFTQFVQKEISGVTPQKVVVSVRIEADEANSPLVDFITASIDAINEDSPLNIQLVEDKQPDWLIWLRDDDRPLRRKLLFLSNQTDQQKIREVGKNTYAIASFDLEEFLSYNFPMRLEQILAKGMIDMAHSDWRELPKHQLPPSPKKVDTSPTQIASPISTWFWGLLVFILLIERFLSLKRESE